MKHAKYWIIGYLIQAFCTLPQSFATRATIFEDWLVKASFPLSYRNSSSLSCQKQLYSSYNTGKPTSYSRYYSSTNENDKPCIIIHDKFNEEMDQLRQICFPELRSDMSTARDIFDERSKHITVMIKGEIAAYGRLTPGPNSVFETISHGKARIPTGQDVIDFGKALVNPKYRGKNLFKVIILSGFQFAKYNSYHSIVGSYRIDSKMGPILQELGFEDSGPPVCILNDIIIQPIVYKINKDNYDWSYLIKNMLDSAKI
ncbi:MAG: hypothetical protein IBJ00_00665 [Alphaproteobacteria bacterium]|nr:hypothetical protein [Alphaproteobacteria bacterium]